MLNSERKKELKSQYLQTKHDMGVFVIRCEKTRRFYIQTARDFRAVINGCKARLTGGFHPIQELQWEWSELGASHFVIEILENLDYDQDESKQNYQEELELLKTIWEEKLVSQNWHLYRKKFAKPR